jgi:hypothetical protein
MAKWRVKPTSDRSNTVTGTFEYESGATGGESTWSMTQDVRPFLEAAKYDRETQKKDKVNGMQKFATVPDVVAIDIKQKWGLDLHDPAFMQDKDSLARLMLIIRQDYPYLLST